MGKQFNLKRTYIKEMVHSYVNSTPSYGTSSGYGRPTRTSMVSSPVMQSYAQPQPMRQSVTYQQPQQQVFSQPMRQSVSYQQPQVYHQPMTQSVVHHQPAPQVYHQPMTQSVVHQQRPLRHSVQHMPHTVYPAPVRHSHVRARSPSPVHVTAKKEAKASGCAIF